MDKELLYRIKTFAPINNLLTDEEIQIVAYHPYMSVTNPWMDESYRFELKNSEAVRRWGLITVVDFCEKMTKAFNEDSLTYTLIEKVFSLDNEDFEELMAYLKDKWNDTAIAPERIIRDYIWSQKKGGASKEVKKLLHLEEIPTLEECKSAYDSMYEVLKGD